MKKDWKKHLLIFFLIVFTLFIGLVGIAIRLIPLLGGCSYQDAVHRFKESAAAAERMYKQLKPCPNCGDTNYSVYRKTKDGKDVSENTNEKDMLVRIACNNDCFIATDYKSSVKEAIDAWNKREVRCLLSEEDLNNHNIGFAVFWGFLLFLMAIANWLNFGAPHAFEDLRADFPFLVFLVHFCIVFLTASTAVKFVHYVIRVLK